MTDLVHIIARYGYQSLFLVLFLESAGLPIPGALALLAAGAAVANGAMHVQIAVAVAVAAVLSADTLLYFAGRYSGWALLRVLCGLSLSPETCMLRSARWFYRRGRITLVIAKFVPGVNAMAPPLAGSMYMRGRQFFALDCAGALTYVLAYGAIGFLFRDLLDDMARGLRAFARPAELVIGASILVYAGYRIWIYAKHRFDRFIPRVPVGNIAGFLKDGGSAAIIIADVRSHGYYDPGAQRAQGSIRLEPNNMDGALDGLSKQIPIYLYCS